MSSVNKIILIGNLARKPELRDVGGGQLATFSLATSRRWNDKQGQPQEVTTWHRVNIWGNQAQVCADRLDKGSLAYVEGSCETRQYVDKDGQQQKVTEVRAQKVEFLDRRAASAPQHQQPAQRYGAPPNQQANQGWPGQGYGTAPQDEDVPF